MDGQHERALARLGRTTRKDARDAMLQVVRGDVLIAMRRPADAVASYDAAIRSMPGWAQPYRGVPWHWRRRGRLMRR